MSWTWTHGKWCTMFLLGHTKTYTLDRLEKYVLYWEVQIWDVKLTEKEKV